MTNEKLKTSIANINAYLSESPADDDTVTLTVNVIRSVKENYEELLAARAEIERLNSPYEMQVEASKKLENSIKIEAVKEFAERLKEKLHLNGAVMGYNCAIVNGVDIDNLVKEMVGETNEQK